MFQQPLNVPSKDRQDEILRLRNQNKGKEMPPYYHTILQDAEEVAWIFNYEDWSTEIYRGSDIKEFPQQSHVTGALDSGGKDRADFRGVIIRGISLDGISMVGVNFSNASLEFTSFAQSDLRGVRFNNAGLEGASFKNAVLRWGDFRAASLTNTDLSGADLRGVLMDFTTRLSNVKLNEETVLADVVWNGVPLSSIDWRPISKIGDEIIIDKKRKELRNEEKIVAFEKAVRANRQLAVALRAQGMNEEADRFAYRAQLCQRSLLRVKHNIPSYLGSSMLDVLAGYGYRPVRSFIAYALVILSFMGLYLLNALFVAPHLTWNEALVLSMSSFHGRGFFNSSTSLGDTYAQIAAIEAFIGLLIEVSFIATFTQRFFGK